MRRPGESAELAAFVRGQRDPRGFPHREHVRLAVAMLSRCDFVTSVQQYSQGLRIMTARAGRPEAFNQTLTIAFLALIAERMSECPDAGFEELVSACPELLDKACLGLWYSRGRLESPAARDGFLLPDRLPRS
jgi:hypothetical protein